MKYFVLTVLLFPFFSTSISQAARDIDPCSSEKRTLCASITPGENAIYTCLVKNLDLVSPQCRTTLVQSNDRYEATLKQIERGEDRDMDTEDNNQLKLNKTMYDPYQKLREQETQYADARKCAYTRGGCSISSDEEEIGTDELNLKALPLPTDVTTYSNDLMKDPGVNVFVAEEALQRYMLQREIRNSSEK